MSFHYYIIPCTYLKKQGIFSLITVIITPNKIRFLLWHLFSFQSYFTIEKIISGGLSDWIQKGTTHSICCSVSSQSRISSSFGWGHCLIAEARQVPLVCLPFGLCVTCGFLQLVPLSLIHVSIEVSSRGFIRFRFSFSGKKSVKCVSDCSTKRQACGSL